MATREAGSKKIWLANGITDKRGARQPLDQAFAQMPHGFIVHEMVREKADGLFRIGATAKPRFDGAGEECDHLVQRACAAGAMPIDRIDVGVDLTRPCAG
jgi:hypothetical protein